MEYDSSFVPPGCIVTDDNEALYFNSQINSGPPYVDCGSTSSTGAFGYDTGYTDAYGNSGAYPGGAYSGGADSGGDDSGGACSDTDNGALDLYGSSCSYYYDQSSCLYPYDDEDFIAAQMCCTCGGGTSYSGGDDSGGDYPGGDDSNRRRLADSSGADSGGAYSGDR